MNKFFLSKTIVIYLAIIFVATVILGTAYTGIQQAIRLSANGPQAEVCQNLVSELQKGKSPQSLSFSSDAADIRSNLSTFFIIYDKSGKAVAASVILDDSTPKIPAGVISYANQHGEDRVTLQPEAGLRFATVVRPAGNYDVVCGRSLKESEKLQDLILRIFALGWVLSVAGILATWPILKFVKGKKT
jgi:hypothetical protein